MNASQFVAQAHAEYVAASTAHDAAFSLQTARLDDAPAPAESPAAKAGAMIAEHGIVGALSRCVTMGMHGEYQGERGEFWQLVASYVLSVASESKA